MLALVGGLALVLLLLRLGLFVALDLNDRFPAALGFLHVGGGGLGDLAPLVFFGIVRLYGFGALGVDDVGAINVFAVLETNVEILFHVLFSFRALAGLVSWLIFYTHNYITISVYFNCRFV